MANPDQPTPNITPDGPSSHEPNKSIRVGPADYVDNSDSSCEDVLNDATIESPTWDSFESGPHFSRPSTSRQQDVGIELDRAIDLSHVLPLTSTPIPTPVQLRRPRISAQRRSLPLEQESHVPSHFLQRLNPFKKKSPPSNQ